MTNPHWLHPIGAVRAVAVLLLLAVAPVAAQEQEAREELRLFDRFTLTLGLSSSDVETDLRLDSKELGLGTELSLEDDLGLDDWVSGVDVKFEWQWGRRHRLAASWLDLRRKDTATVERDLLLGDLLIPTGATSTVEFDVTDWRMSYTYYPWLRERWALGGTFGLRVLDIDLVTTIDSYFGDVDLDLRREEADVVGPLPFVGLEYRSLITPRWRLMAAGGWLEARVGDYDGSQWIADVSIQNLVGQHWGWGFDLGYAAVDVQTEDDDFRGKVDLHYTTPRIFAKFYW